MSGQQIYTGFWVDHSHPAAIGATWTVSATAGGYVVSAIATLIGVTGERAWTIIAFLLHQWYADDAQVDPLTIEHSVALRNPGSTISSFLELLQIGFAWRKNNVRHPQSRSLVLCLSPMILWVFFKASGILSSYVASSSSAANDVLLQSTHCGMPGTVNGNIENLVEWTQKMANDTRTARSYVGDCYGLQASALICESYPTKSLPYTVNVRAACPFGGTNRCVTGDNGAYSLDTGFLDSHDYLGINADPKDRVQFRKVVTCSVLNVLDTMKQHKDQLTNDETETFTFYMGNIRKQSDYTFLYQTLDVLASITYELTSIYYAFGANPENEVYLPTPDFNASNADSSFHFISSNNVHYIAPNNDPLYKATLPWTKKGPKYCRQNYYVNVMGCAEQFQFKDPTTGVQTTLSGQIATNVEALGWNPIQRATLARLRLALAVSSIYNTVNGQGNNAPVAQSLLVGAFAPQLPNNQWQTEVRTWFETSLATVQKVIVDFPNNLWDLGRTTPPTVLTPNSILPAVVGAALRSQCGQQKIRNVGSYQNISVLGVSVVLLVCSVIIILSFSLNRCVFANKKRKPGGSKYHKRLAYEADGKLQLVRMMLQAKSYTGWEPGHEEIPIGKKYQAAMTITRPREDTSKQNVEYPPANEAADVVNEPEKIPNASETMAGERTSLDDGASRGEKIAGMVNVEHSPSASLLRDSTHKKATTTIVELTEYPVRQRSSQVFDP